MGFDVNPLNNAAPSFKAQKSTDGGAGNLGYFEREKKEEEKGADGEPLEKEKSIFGSAKEDTFTLSDAKKSSYADEPWTIRLLEFLKNIVAQIKNSLLYK